MERLPLARLHWGVAAGALLLLLASTGASAAAPRSHEADLYYERGAHALRKGEAEAAVEYLGRAIELVPDDPDALALYARALLLLGRPDQAVEALEDLRYIAPSAPDLELMLGLARSRLGQWRAARDHLEVAREREPQSSRVHLFLGIAYQELGQNEAAERELREAFALDPALELPRASRLALLALSQNRTSEAHQLFEQVLTRLPGSSLADSAALYLLLMQEGEARRWEAYASVGVGYDTNVNLFGDELVTQGIPALGSRESDSFGEVEAGVEGIVWERARMRLWLGSRGNLIAYRHESDLDIQATDGWALLSYDLTDRLGLDLRYDLSWVWADWESFRRTSSIEPALRFFARDDLYARVFYRYDDRSFFTETGAIDEELDRDGNVQEVGIDQYWIPPDLRGWGRGYLRVGLRYRSEDSRGDEYDSHGPIGVVTLGLPLPFRAFLTLDGGYEQREFDHPSLFEPGEGDRDDHITRIRILLQRQLSQRIDVAVGWLYTHWSSNVGVYDFDRSVSDLRLTYRY